MIKYPITSYRHVATLPHKHLCSCVGAQSKCFPVLSYGLDKPVLCASINISLSTTSSTAHLGKFSTARSQEIADVCLEMFNNTLQAEQTIAMRKRKFFSTNLVL